MSRSWLAAIGTKRVARVSAGLAAVSLVVLAVASLMRTDAAEPPNAGHNALDGMGRDTVVVSAPSFTIGGNLAGAPSPGAARPLKLSLTNRHSFNIAVTRLTVTLQGLSAPNSDAALPCTKADFAVTQLPRPYKLTVPAHRKSSLKSLGLPRTEWPRIGMLNTPVNQDGCKGATLQLEYTGAASRSAS